jgi:hypothetical protein
MTLSWTCLGRYDPINLFFIFDSSQHYGPVFLCEPCVYFFQCRTAQTMASPSLMGTGNWSSRFQFSTSSLPSCEIFRICGCGGGSALDWSKVVYSSKIASQMPFAFGFSV